MTGVIIDIIFLKTLQYIYDKTSFLYKYINYACFSNKFKYPGSVLLVNYYVGKHSAVEAMGVKHEDRDRNMHECGWHPHSSAQLSWPRISRRVTACLSEISKEGTDQSEGKGPQYSFHTF